MIVSEYDLISAVNASGSYRVMTPPSKVLLGQVLYLALFDTVKGETFTVVYRDGKKYAYAKHVHIQKFVRNREYSLVADKAGQVDKLSAGPAKGQVHFAYQPGARQRVVEGSFKLNSLELVGVGTRGTKLAPRPVTRLRVT